MDKLSLKKHLNLTQNIARFSIETLYFLFECLKNVMNKYLIFYFVCNFSKLDKNHDFNEGNIIFIIYYFKHK